MHAYCLISAVGARTRPLLPDLDQPPAFKTRRSNAVHARRLTLRLDLLDKHLVALETERARTVRRLHEELDHLRMSKCSHVTSPPRHEPRVGGLSRKSWNKQDQGRQHKPRHGVGGEGDGKALATTHVLESQDGCAESTAHDDDKDFPTAEIEVAEKHSSKRPSSPDSKLVKDSKKENDGFDNKNGMFLPELGDKIRGVEIANGENTDIADTETMSRKGTKPKRRASGPQPASTQSHPREEPTSIRISRPGRNSTAVAAGQTSNLQYMQHREVPELPRRPSVARALSPESPARPQESIFEEKPQHPQAETPVAISLPALTKSPLSRPSSRAVTRKVRSGETCPLERRTCGYFPCRRPCTYHSLGFYPDPTPQPWRSWIAQNARRPHHRLHPNSRDQPDPPGSSAGGGERKRLGREEVVRLDMARKKQRQALTRPPAWPTNYGNPTTLRRLKYPARLTPLH